MDRKYRQRTAFASLAGAWLLLIAGTGHAAAEAEFVGSQQCELCHEQQYSRWRGSQHREAMREASEQTVLGDFNDARFEHAGVTSRFYRRNGRFLVETDGMDAKLAEFEVRYTFGIYPLQQYLVPMPRGHYQALAVGWDSRPVDQGGQRWFHLNGDEQITHEDPLHWTGPYMRWNSRCAECHSTRVSKGYDVQTDTYDTQWSEISVGCEACHGPGSEHARLAVAKDFAGASHFGLIKPSAAAGDFAFQDGLVSARRTDGATPDHRQIDMCGSCHSRRTLLRTWQHDDRYFDSHMPILLDPPLYHPDGQILDEVYVYGSFVQSRMYQHGVVCSNCHDPHDLSLRGDGDDVCLQCHRAQQFASANHHRHKPEFAGARCVACHMPSRTYMVVDPRRDHSLRVPDPWLAMRGGGQDACSLCHADRDPVWAANIMRDWGFKERGKRHFGERLTRSAGGGVEAADALRELAMDGALPAMVRATALTRIRARDETDLRLLAESLRDEDELVRIAAVRSASKIDENYRRAMLWPLLADPVPAVRIEVAGALVETPPEQLSDLQRNELARGIEEYLQAQAVMADTAAAQLNIAYVAAVRGRPQEAEVAYKLALRNEPANIIALLNYADFLRQQHRDKEAYPYLHRAITIAPTEGSVHHAYGLFMVRQGRSAEALDHFRLAAAYAPEVGRFAYVYAVALQSAGKIGEAVRIAESQRSREPDNAELLRLLLDLYRAQGNRLLFEKRLHVLRALMSSH